MRGGRYIRLINDTIIGGDIIQKGTTFKLRCQVRGINECTINYKGEVVFVKNENLKIFSI